MPQPGQPQPRGEDWLVREVQELKQALREKGATDPFAGTALTVTPNSVTVDGSQTINGGPLSVNGNAAVSGTFDVGGAATFYVATAFNGTAGIYGHATFTGGATFSSDAAFTGYTTFSGAMFNGGTTFNGASTFNGGVTVASDASLSGYTTLSGTRVNGILTVANDASFTGYTTHSGAAFNGTSTFAGPANFNGGATFSSSPSFSALVNMPGGATVGGTLTAGTTNITGTLTHSGNFSIGSSAGQVSITGGNLDVQSSGHVYIEPGIGRQVSIFGNFAVTGTKAFVMPHPNAPDTMTLMHCATESDRNGVEYWGTATTDDDGTATVTLPGYFEALTKGAGRNIQLTPAGKATVIPWASDISGGKFTINADPGLKINWLVKAERHRIVNGVDTLAFEAEQNQPLEGR